ncbi:secreted protein : Putative secreted protein OS=Blastopirellula marina DSM 3645 GN=DSM3645_25497 PE=4 SV=1: Lipase_GDSL_2 [Gemmataceae bacterium]|nr:secreted protein : Putative secreted protein OS=Blastopirellula marina DSM 3645 GN=DSM3645_25497 PE=4 SV=1: Lipase_GDSL_2 [Gemmataceae bacterium]VTT99678.1 secreted protein : Putative secreted protein OS=Blastopirellula marina DSM 3645 GN=DSM3645_25497 PE=4 SV=1: Lipase_GDSL_2 [Gemmataceae bacterium]
MLPLLLAAAVSAPDVAPPPRAVDPFAKWEKSIAAIEKRLAAAPPRPGGVFFVGSSSIVMWDLNKSFPEAGYVNVGFGGSVIADSVHFAPRIVTPFKPGTIVFYAGDNDIGGGRKPEQVAADFKAFVGAVRADNPSCKVLFIAVKPSTARWKKFDEQKEANALVKAYCEKGTGLVYVDVVPLMLGADGAPAPELFLKDGLHMTPKGYELWTAAVGKALK